VGVRGSRWRAVAAALAAAVALAGCANVVSGNPAALTAADAKLHVIGGTNGRIDTLVQNALADVTTFWKDNYPKVSGGKSLPPLKGGLYSIDASEVVNTGKIVGPAGTEGCVAEDPTFIVDNAAYCKADDSIVWDRDPSHIFGLLSQKYGDLMVALAFAHEYGHAIQERLGIFDQHLETIKTESQADCAAGAFLAAAQSGKALHFRPTAAQIDLALNGYLLVRDTPPVTTGDISHGDGFDRLSAIDDGLTKGVGYCYSDSYFSRGFTERPFVSDQDYQTGGNESLAQVLDPNDPAKDPNAGGLIPDLNRYFKAAASKAGTTWKDVSIAQAPHPKCGASATSEFGYCPDDNTVYYSQSFAAAAYNSLADLSIDKHTGNASLALNQAADFALGTMFAMGWGMATLHQLANAPIDTKDALLSAACYTGAYAKDINIVPTQPAFVLSPPDMDEATSAMLNLVGDDRAYGARGTTGLERVQAFVKGYNKGFSSC
jgi:predicted metalloprotease